MKVWNTLKTTYKVSDFISWQKNGGLILNPYFQRRSVWKAGAKSYLIDTILRGLPIPIIFLRDRPSRGKTPLRDVVDGQQRLRTVIAFIEPKFLKDFDPERDNFVIDKNHNDKYKGLKFEQLPPAIQNQILDYQFTVNVFPSDTSDREVKQVFARMNSSGYILNAQELRNAEYFGAFKTTMEKLATEQLDNWRQWKIFSSDGLARMQEVELTSELVIVMLAGLQEKNPKGISEYYQKYDEDFPKQGFISARFRYIFDSIEKNLRDVMSKVFRKRTVFYALFSVLYDLHYGIGSELVRAKPKPITAKQITYIISKGQEIVDGKAPQEVMESTTRRVSHLKERTNVFEHLFPT